MPGLHITRADRGRMRLRQRIDQAALLVLIEQAYASTEAGVGWEPFLHSLGDHLGIRVAALMSHDLTESGGIVVNVRADPEATRLYNEQWCFQDPFALSPRARRLAVPGSVLVDEMLVPYRDLQKTEYFRGFSVKYDVARLLTASLAYDDFGLKSLSLTRAHGDAPFGPAEMRFLAALTPHVQRACRLHDVMGRAQRIGEDVRHSLDAIPIGILFVDQQCRVVHANNMARLLLERRDGLLVDSKGLKGATSEVTTRLRHLCHRCATLDMTVGDPGGPLMLPRPSGRASLHALVLPLRTPETFGLRRDEAAALIWVSDPSIEPRPIEERLRAYYGLTPAESAVASRLALGHALEDVADALHYTRDTARWYSKQVMSKVGCRTRPELVRRLASLLLTLAHPDVR